MNNPPAFPVFPETGGGHAAAFQGMSLRDYFAAKAMQEMMVDVYAPNFDYIANTAYEMADAMMKAREA